jgi:hypothetical protein
MDRRARDTSVGGASAGRHQRSAGAHAAIALVSVGLFLAGFALSASGAPAVRSAASFTYCAPQQPNVLIATVWGQGSTPVDTLIAVCNQKRIVAMDVTETSSRSTIGFSRYYNSSCKNSCGTCAVDTSFYRELHCTGLVSPPVTRSFLYIRNTPHPGDLIEVSLHFSDGTVSTSDITLGLASQAPTTWMSPSSSTERPPSASTTGDTNTTTTGSTTTQNRPPTTKTKTTTTTTPQNKPCKCQTLKVKIDGNLFTKARLRPDQQDFGIGFNWVLVCTGGKGKCTGSITFSPPTILAGTLPKPTGVLRLNLKKMVFSCQAPCGAATVGSFKIQMLKRDQLNVLFGRTVAFSIKKVCHGVASTTRIRVLVERDGRLKLV